MKGDWAKGGFVIRETGQVPKAYIVVDHPTGVWLHYQPFDAQSTGLVSWVLEVDLSHIQLVDWHALLSPVPPNGAISRTEYLQLVTKARQFAGEHQGKVVTSRVALFQGESNPIQVFYDLCQAYPSLNVHLFFHPCHGVWTGATPEVLLDLEEGKIRAMSLAGTQLAGQKTIGEKEEQEQYLVTKQLVEHFKELGVGNIAYTPTELWAAGPVEHLLTWVSGSWSGSAEKALAKLHPTPAVCGYPREEARKFLAEEEGYNRQFYAGYFGLETSNRSRFYVNLRCASFWQKGVALYAGGGITAASIPEQEWDETVRKMTTLERVMKRSL